MDGWVDNGMNRWRDVSVNDRIQAVAVQLFALTFFQLCCMLELCHNKMLGRKKSK